MARTDAFLAALDAGARSDALDELIAAVEHKEGPEAHVRCVDAWAQQLVRTNAEPDDVRWIRSRLALALENAAEARGPRAPEFALEALRLQSEMLEDEDGRNRVACLALTLCASDPDRIYSALDAVGGADDGIALLKKHAKTPEVKAEPLRIAHVRRAISRIYTLTGEHEPAFFESLKVIRKAPFEQLYVDESVTLAEKTGRHSELALVLRDLAKDDSLPARHRASMYNKVGHLLERELDDPAGALDAYIASLRLAPSTKGPRRHAARLASELGVDFEMPSPAPEATVDEPAPGSMLSWSSNDDSYTDAAFEGDRTEAVVPQGEFSSSAAMTSSIRTPGDEPKTAADVGIDAESESLIRADTVVRSTETDVPDAEEPASSPDDHDDAVDVGASGIPASDVDEEGETPPRQEGTKVTPRAISIPGAAPPDAPTALELEAPEAQPVGSTPDAGELGEESDASSDGVISDHSEVEPADEVADDSDIVFAVNASGFESGFAPPPLPGDADDDELEVSPEDAGQLTGVISPPPPGLSVSGIPLDIVEDVLSPATGPETTGVFADPGSEVEGAHATFVGEAPGPAEAASILPNLDAIAAAALEEVPAEAPDDVFADAASKAGEAEPKDDASENATKNKNEAAANIAVPLDPYGADGEATEQMASPPSQMAESSTTSRRKRKKQKRKQKRKSQAEAEKAPDLLPGMRPEDLLPVRVSTSPGRRLPPSREPDDDSERDVTLRTTLEHRLVPGPSLVSDSDSREPDAPDAVVEQDRAAEDNATEGSSAEDVEQDRAAEDSVAEGSVAEGSAADPEGNGPAADVTVGPARRVSMASSASVSPATSSLVSSEGSSVPGPDDSNLPSEGSNDARADDTPSEVERNAVVAAQARDEPISTEAMATALLEGEDSDACIEMAQQILASGRADALALELTSHAMLLQVSKGLPSETTRQLFLRAMEGHEEAALDAAREIKENLGEDAPFMTDFFVEVARLAGPWTGTEELLHSLALVDAPFGLAFERLDEHYTAHENADARLKLWIQARKEATEPGAQAALDDGHLTQLHALGRLQDWRTAHADRALASPLDDAIRDAAQSAWSEAPPPDRARFVGRLARALEGNDAAIDLFREVLRLRLEIGDDLGAEAATGELLKARPGDKSALHALTEVLGRSAHRRDDLIDTLRTRAQIAANTNDELETETVALRLHALLKREGRENDALDALSGAVESIPSNATLVSAYLDALQLEERYEDLVDVAERLAPQALKAGEICALWMRAATTANTSLHDPDRAKACVEQALESNPRALSALQLHADVALATGELQDAYHALERLVAEIPGADERALVHLQMGRLLENELDRAADAIKRYRAAAETAPTTDAYSALRSLAVREGDSEQVSFALRGLIQLEEVPRLRAALEKQLARHIRTDGDDAAIRHAYIRVLADDPTDEESRNEIVATVVREHGGGDVDEKLDDPSDAFLGDLFEPLSPLFDLDAKTFAKTVPFRLRRAFAIGDARASEDVRARAGFERLLDEDPTDARSLTELIALLAPLQTDDAEERRLRLLEQLLLHHGPELPDVEQVTTWSEVCRLRKEAGQPAGALTAAKRALALATDDSLRAAIPTAAVEAAVTVLEVVGNDDADARLLVAAQRLLAGREPSELGAERLAKTAETAERILEDTGLARSLLEDAVQLAPHLRAPREALLQLDIRGGDPDQAIETTATLLSTETDDKRRAGHHLRLSKLFLRAREDAASAAEHLRQAIELDPENATALDDAEVLFTEQDDAEGLAALYSAQLSHIDKANIHGRNQLLERLAQVRRYDLRDLAGAAEALEAITALDPAALKPREDTARIYSELGRWKEAATAWRGVLDRDPVHEDAWRGIVALYANSGQEDETFGIASAMSAVELAPDDVIRAVRSARPPFPRWPKVPSDLTSVRRRLSHDLERAPIRAVFEVCGRRLHRVFARPLKDFGLRKRDDLNERDVPGSVSLAIRVTSQLLGLQAPPRLYRGDLGATSGQVPPFALLPTPEPGLIVTDDVIRGGMTPERAFALGRAMAWLTPHGLLAGTLDASSLRAVLEALVHVYLPGSEVEGDGPEVRENAKKIRAGLEKGLGTKDAANLKKALCDALRSYVHSRSHLPVADWVAGVAYTGDRLGFLLAGDHAPSFRVLQQAAGEGEVLGARLAIKELVLFSISSEYLSLRRDLGLALTEGEGQSLLELL